MKLDEFDLSYNPIRVLDYGSKVIDVEVPGGQTASFAQVGAKRSFPLRLWVTAPAMGGAAAGSQAANEYLAHMLEEWLNNPLLNDPVLVSLSSLRALPQDGWYVAENAKPDYRFTGAQRIPIDLTMTYKAPGPPTPRRLGMWRGGGAIPTNWGTTAPAVTLGFPIGATLLESATTGIPPSAFTRTGAEGAIPILFDPQSNPSPFVPSVTLANLFKGGCRVFDTLNTGSNPVPAAPGAYHANWIEVKGVDHSFVGDLVLTNGLLLMLFQVGATPLATVYLWSTGLATPGWQQVATLQDVGPTPSTASPLRSYSPIRVSKGECAISIDEDYARLSIRLARAGYGCRIDYRARGTGMGLQLVFPAIPKILYNDSFVADNVLLETASLDLASGMAAALLNSSTYPFLGGFHYANQSVGTLMPAAAPAGSATIASGDVGPVADSEQSYGIWFFPYGVSGSYSPANLQSEAESGTLGTGWTSQANALASAGNEAKAASGTVTGNADTFGTAFIPKPGRYLLRFRVKVTSAAGSVAEMTLGLWNNDTSAFSSSVTFKANQATTGYGWLDIGLVVPPAGNNVRFRAVTAATLGTDWFVDEAVLLPIDRFSASHTGYGDGPTDLFNQFLSDTESRLAVS